MDEILANLAKSNINVLGVEYSEGEPQVILFEYQWRMPNTAVKWTRGAIDWDAGLTFSENLRRLPLVVKSIRSQLER